MRIANLDAFLKLAWNLENIDDNQKMFLKELLGKIVQWVFKHIITTDFMYKDYLLKLGMK